MSDFEIDDDLVQQPKQSAYGTSALKLLRKMTQTVPESLTLPVVKSPQATKPNKAGILNRVFSRNFNPSGETKASPNNKRDKVPSPKKEKLKVFRFII